MGRRKLPDFRNSGNLEAPARGLLSVLLRKKHGWEATQRKNRQQLPIIASSEFLHGVVKLLQGGREGRVDEGERI